MNITRIFLCTSTFLVFLFTSCNQKIASSEKMIFEEESLKVVLKDTCLGKLVDGERQGLWKCYYNNKIHEMTYVQGQVNGFLKTFDSEMNLELLESVVNGVRNGIVTYYNKNGSPVFIDTYEKGIRVSSVSYFENGVVKALNNYVIGEIADTVITFHPETYKKQISTRKVQGSVKEGKWSFFTNEGKLMKEVFYKKDSLIYIKEY